MECLVKFFKFILSLSASLILLSPSVFVVNAFQSNNLKDLPLLLIFAFFGSVIVLILNNENVFKIVFKLFGNELSYSNSDEKNQPMLKPKIAKSVDDELKQVSAKNLREKNLPISSYLNVIEVYLQELYCFDNHLKETELSAEAMIESDSLKRILGLSTRMRIKKALSDFINAKEDDENLIKEMKTILEQLKNSLIDNLIVEKKRDVITPKESWEAMEQRYTVRTIIPYVDKPEKREYVFNQFQLDLFLDGYDEVAEFIYSINPYEEPLLEE